MYNKLFPMRVKNEKLEKSLNIKKNLEYAKLKRYLYKF